MCSSEYPDNTVSSTPLQVLSFYKISEDAQIPKLATAGSACFDLSADIIDRDIILYNNRNEKIVKNGGEFKKVAICRGDRVLIPTGLIMDIPSGHSVRIHPRSGLSLKLGITLGNCEAVIDSDYVHETFIMLTNVSNDPVYIDHGMRIAQAELVKNVNCILSEKMEKPEQKTERDGGFGSTGTS
jgi:dUTP pyrophosphatase